MINWGLVLAKIITWIMSWVFAKSLRTQMYETKNKNEILYTALEDIARMDRGGKMGTYAQQALDLVDKL
jgi:hypothetical protein